MTLTETVISNMLVPEIVAQQVRTSKNSASETSQLHSWGGSSLDRGFAGILLMLGTLAKKNLIPSPDEVLHRYVVAMKEEIEKRGISSLSLFSGASGYAFAIQQASLDENRYQTMIDSLDHFLFDHLDQTYLAPFKKYKLQNLSVPSFLHDIIQGVSGVGRYLLDKIQIERAEEALKKILSTLVEWTLPREVHGKLVPGWHLSSEDPLNKIGRFHSKKGNFNLGLAHGITGVLALLAIASLKGVEVDGQRECMDYIQHWIREKSFTLKGGIHWPCSISWEEEVGEVPLIKQRSHDGWCYGVPGIARTLYLTGSALRNSSLTEFAKEAFRGVFQREEQDWQLPGPNLCHGIAGLLSITKSMSEEGDCEEFKTQLAPLQAKLMNHASEKAIWMFQDSERTTKGSLQLLDKPGFLEGSAGVLLTLATLSDPNPHWHLPLMIHV